MMQIGVTTARDWLHGTDEIAFLDVREAGEFGEGHALFATPLPYSQLELRIGAMVPRLDARIMLVDGGDGVAQRAAARLDPLGYSNVSFVTGGMPAWAAAGFPIYKGVNVPSKTLGELVEAIWHPAMLQPAALAAWQASGENFAFFDTRPREEYAKMRVPGTQCVPNGELAHRLASLDHDAPIVVTCAGRTRGIIGAIGLRLSGHAGPVYALENGTQGWTLAGLPLERGNAPAPYPDLDAAGSAQSRDRAAALRDRYGIDRVDGAQAARMLGQTDRTTYLFDLRTSAEYAQDPVHAAQNVLGGQLVQATDQWVGVRRSRIILACEGGLRSTLAAFWLRQLGYDVFVVAIDAALRAMPYRQTTPPPLTRAGVIHAKTALAAVKAGALLVDLRGSMAYRHDHIDGAVWAIRPRIAALGPLNDRSVVVIADNRETASIAAIEFAASGARRVDWVDGGHQAMVAAGARRLHRQPRPTDRDAIDHLFFVHDRHDGNLDACRQYLAWETGLMAQLDDLERAEFRLTLPD